MAVRCGFKFDVQFRREEQTKDQQLILAPTSEEESSVRRTEVTTFRSPHLEAAELECFCLE